MAPGFQKTAKMPRELALSHPGIIDDVDFREHFELHCYEPSPDLRPFVTHVWIQRRKDSPMPLRVGPTEIATGANAYAFFTTDSAFIQIAKHAFAYDPLSSAVVAGIKFAPGGLYAFLRQPVSGISDSLLPVTSIFPQADDVFRAELLAQPDDVIVALLEDLLRSAHPQRDRRLDLVDKILQTIAEDTSPRTVGAIARTFSLSERSLQLLLQTYVGVGAKWIMSRARLLEAIGRMQDSPGMRWSEIAHELGYSSQSHFSREFKDVIGQSPTQYLRSQTPVARDSVD